MGTRGTAPPPRRAALLAIPGVMDPRRAQTRSGTPPPLSNTLTGVNDGNYFNLKTIFSIFLYFACLLSE